MAEVVGTLECLTLVTAEMVIGDLTVSMSLTHVHQIHASMGPHVTTSGQRLAVTVPKVTWVFNVNTTSMIVPLIHVLMVVLVMILLTAFLVLVLLELRGADAKGIWTNAILVHALMEVSV